jgi:hypothetical protein
MTNNPRTLLCLIEGESLPNAFSVQATPTGTIDNFKGLIKPKQSNQLSNIDADHFTLWHISIPDDQVMALIMLVNLPNENLTESDRHALHGL